MKLNKWFSDQGYKQKFWTRISIAKILVLFIAHIYLGTNINLAQRVLDVAPLLAGWNPIVDIKTSSIFINYVVGIIVFILVYSIPKLGARLVQMYYLPFFTDLFGIMASQRRKPIIFHHLFFICLLQICNDYSK